MPPERIFRSKSKFIFIVFTDDQNGGVKPPFLFNSHAVL